MVSAERWGFRLESCGILSHKKYSVQAWQSKAIRDRVAENI